MNQDIQRNRYVEWDGTPVENKTISDKLKRVFTNAAVVTSLGVAVVTHAIAPDKVPKVVFDAGAGIVSSWVFRRVITGLRSESRSIVNKVIDTQPDAGMRTSPDHLAQAFAVRNSEFFFGFSVVSSCVLGGGVDPFFLAIGMDRLKTAFTCNKVVRQPNKWVIIDPKNMQK